MTSSIFEDKVFHIHSQFIPQIQFEYCACHILFFATSKFIWEVRKLLNSFGLRLKSVTWCPNCFAS